jgi:phosphate transport system protein
MTEKVKEMLRMSLDALVNMDADMAQTVLTADDEVDALNRGMHQEIIEHIRANPDQLDYLIQLLSVSKYLERIADLATNIAEDVIYLIKGEIVRHQPEEDVQVT